jgi:hypothetical protein
MTESGGLDESAIKAAEKRLLAANLTRDETKVRTDAIHNVFYLVPINGYSSVVIFLLYLISIESLISIGSSIGMTIFAYRRIVNDATFNGLSMNWVLLSFAVITPISSLIGMAFQRREASLASVASIRATFFELYASHAIWDWDLKPGDEIITGRTKSTVDWLVHSDKVLENIFGICTDLTRYLTLPNSSRARHKVTQSGRKEAQNTQAVAVRINESIIRKFAKLASFCEVLKREGMPGNESARIRQWELLLLEHIEKLRMIKMYRTPQALRSFSRLFSLILPPFFAPYYAELARALNSLGTAIAFAVFTSLALTSLFESIFQMEDPFVNSSVLDGVRVKEQLFDELAPQLLAMRRCFFPQSGEFTLLSGDVPEGTSSLDKWAISHLWAE